MHDGLRSARWVNGGQPTLHASHSPSPDAAPNDADGSA
jgi:hypothetical protein